ncbi:MAG TPA: beta-ketoacyl synthase chain length factor [Candidatus Competibacter sp.]|nr:beta-ketoacyl synthase chain length factor [Candidatus Competibacter sp.]
MKALTVERIGLCGPGLLSWTAGRETLAGGRPYAPDPLPAIAAALLPANERRRVTATIKLALHAAQEAVGPASAAASDEGPAAALPTVFVSSGGDSEVLDKICAALTLPDRAVSPVHFHQSVHNTPSGYWSIATSCRRASTSLSAYDGSFGYGLLEAAALAWAEATPVLLVAYDLPLPFPLSDRRRIVAPFAVALLLSPHPAGGLATLRLAPAADAPASRLTDPELERLRVGNPAARALPLLSAIARQTAESILLVERGRGIRVEVEPA